MSEISVGTEIPALELAPISRYTLALYAGASGDHNPIHIDSDFAKSAGMPDVFAHGMLSMAYLGRMLTNWQPQAKLRQVWQSLCGYYPAAGCHYLQWNGNRVGAGRW